jgi:hypothetical protein
MTAVLMVFTVKISLARGAASPFEMRILQRRRADQLTMLKKIMGREAAENRDEEQLRNFGWLCTKTPNLTADNADNHGSKKFKRTHFEFVNPCHPVHPW